MNSFTYQHSASTITYRLILENLLKQVQTMLTSSRQSFPKGAAVQRGASLNAAYQVPTIQKKQITVKKLTTNCKKTDDFTRKLPSQFFPISFLSEFLQCLSFSLGSFLQFLRIVLFFFSSFSVPGFPTWFLGNARRIWKIWF